MYPRPLSNYNVLVQATRVKKELGLLSESDDSDEDNNEDLEHEIWFLRSSLEYYYHTSGVYPFGSSKAREDFCKNWVHMTERDYSEENHKMRKKYKDRVKNVCMNGQVLQPREQEAFELGNKIWGSTREDHSRGEVEKEHEDILARFPFLKETFKFMRIPVLSDEDVKEGLAALGSAKLKEWNDKWKEIQVSEIKIFLEKVNIIRQQTILLLEEIQRTE